MRGDLSETPAAEVCRTLAADDAGGTLELDGPDGPGHVVFAAGRIVAATSPTPRARLGDRLVGAGLLEDEALTEALRVQAEAPEHTRLGALLVDGGHVSRDAVRLFVQEQVLDALFDVLSWRYGAYRFVDPEPSADVPEVPLAIPVDEALVEVARRQQEWEELSRVIPDLEAVPAFRSSASTASAPLEPDEFAVLASVDGVRSIRQLASDLGYGEFEAARIVYGLSLLGVVDVHLPEDEVGAALDDALAYVTGQDEPEPEPSSTPPTAPPDAPPPGAGRDAHDATTGDAGEGTVIEADLPAPDEDLGTVLAPTGSDAGPSRLPASGPPAAPDAPATSSDPSDVAEFLRELSRLAIEDAPPAPPGRPARPKANAGSGGAESDKRSGQQRSGGEDSKRKRRGFFGRG